MIKILLLLKCLCFTLLEDRKIWNKNDIDYLIIVISAQILFPEEDSKYFTDLPLKEDLTHTLQSFEKIKPELGLKKIKSYDMSHLNHIIKNTVFSILGLKRDFSQTLNIKEPIESGNLKKSQKESLKNKRKIMSHFIKHNFLKVGADIEPNTDKSYFVKNENLEYFSKVINKKIISLAYDINETWKNLSKKRVENVISSLKELKYPFFIPGGRFREFYYWDSYWILRGLLISKMDKAAKSLIKNFLELLEKNNFIPNGTRGYYSRRTQPPFFCLMLKALYKYSPKFHNLVLTKGLKAAEKEFEFFEKKRTIDVNVSGIKYKMFMYRALRNIPRTESLKEDFENWFNSSKKAQKDIYIKFKTAAESGIDFTSRSFKIPSDRKTIDILNRIPVDLNALMYNNARFISRMFKKLGDFEKSKLYKEKAKSIKKNINKFFWVPEKCMWCDLIINTMGHVNNVYFSNFYPMIFGIKPPKKRYEEILHFHKRFFFKNKGGIPAGEKIEGVNEQWNHPNVWAPYNQMMIEFLLKIGQHKKALLLARKFFRSVLVAFKRDKVFYEKYNSEIVGKAGDGGEYKSQSGFGWTNGTVIYLIDQFGDKLIKSKKLRSKSTTK